MRYAAAFILVVPLCVSASLGADRTKVVKEMQANWEKVRLLDQRMVVTVADGRATLAGSFHLQAQEDAPGTVFAFPSRKLPTRGTVSVKADGQDLSLIKHVIPEPQPKDAKTPKLGGRNWHKKLKKEQKAREERSVGQAIRLCLDSHTGYGSYTTSAEDIWYAYRVDLKKGVQHEIRVEAGIIAYALADSDKGPCHAYRIPLRLARLWAGPLGKLSLKVTLPESVKPDEIILVRPPEAKRAGRTITIEVDGSMPDEDFFLVMKGKLKPVKQPAPTKPGTPKKPKAPPKDADF